MAKGNRYKTRSKEYTRKTYYHFNLGNLCEASDLAIKAYAEGNNLEHSKHVIARMNDYKLNSLLQSVAKLHTNFYENLFEAKEIHIHLNDVDKTNETGNV